MRIASASIELPERASGKKENASPAEGSARQPMSPPRPKSLWAAAAATPTEERARRESSEAAKAREASASNSPTTVESLAGRAPRAPRAALELLVEGRGGRLLLLDRLRLLRGGDLRVELGGVLSCAECVGGAGGRAEAAEQDRLHRERRRELHQLSQAAGDAERVPVSLSLNGYTDERGLAGGQLG